MTRRTLSLSLILAVVSALLVVAPAVATPVCTDGYEGGPPRSDCGGRVFPEATDTTEYVQYQPNPLTGFREYQHGLEYLAKLYPRWLSVSTLSTHYGTDDAVSAGPDQIRSYEGTDTDDGYEILVAKLTDHNVPDAGKQTLLYSLSIHGDEKGGIEGGVRAIEDLAMAAENGGKITDGVEGYESASGRQPEFHEVKDVLAKQAVYFVDFNIDGWVRGDHTNIPPAIPAALYTRGNYMGTDLNRQMPTVGRINPSRNPLEESEMLYGHRFMHEVADAGVDGRLAYGADIHGESQSRAWVDIMYPAGQFDSIKHRRLMAIAERTKSVIDATLYMGLAEDIEEATGGDQGEGIEDLGFPPNTVPTKPARWGTVWDTLGYTDTGFVGDYLAEELGVTGMDYEIAFNHADAARPFGRPWAVLLQENYINASRAIIKTAMAYAMKQDQDFADFQIDPKGQVGYVFTPEVITDKDGVGTLPGPNADGIGENGLAVEQQPYSATQMNFFAEEGRLIKNGFRKVLPADIASDPKALEALDTLVLADLIAPPDAEGRTYDRKAYLDNVLEWVKSGGNLFLIDRGLHALGELGVVPADQITDIKVYQPYSNFTDFEHPMLAGLRPNARQLSEATLIGYGIGNTASPMTVVASAAWEEAGGYVVGTTGPGAGTSDNGAQTSVGQLELGAGQVRIMGGGLHTPTEENDHRYGLKDYSLTYSGLYIIENSIVHDAPKLGIDTKCFGYSAKLNHLVGTDAAEVLRGTKNADVICGAGGNDRISGLGAGDILIGGGGNDKLRGQRGADTAIGGSGNDILGGGSGKDRLAGRQGRDTLRGHGGNDKLLGHGGKDRLGGAKGNDRLNGGPGKDRCRGGAGTNRTKSCE
jgi:RTX calcium-binding nonapeptide repeat (4 copies)/Zinc carboxypeptidase